MGSNRSGAIKSQLFDGITTMVVELSKLESAEPQENGSTAEEAQRRIECK
jgi:hypothetical protein